MIHPQASAFGAGAPPSNAGTVFSRPRLVIFAAALALVAVAAACASVADLDVTYGGSASGADASSEDTRQRVRDSLIEASSPVFPPNEIEDGGGGLPCNAEAGLSGEEDGGCDEGAGNGCCLRGSVSGTTGSVCMSHAQAREQCSLPSAKGVFVACRQSRNDDVCCWRDLPNGGRAAFYAGDCDGGPIACIEDAGCAVFGQACTTTTCKPTGFVIGQCGATAPACPEGL